MKNKKYFLIIPFIFIFIILSFRFQFIWDEHTYFVTSQLFGENFPNLDLKNYYSFSEEFISTGLPIIATTPLSMIIYGSFGRIFGYDILIFRTIAMLFGLGTMLVFYSILEYLKIKNPLMKTFLFLFYPYTILLSFLSQSDTIALFFFVLVLKYFLRKQFFLASFFSTLAIYTRQEFLFLIPAMFSSYLLSERKAIIKTFKERSLFKFANQKIILNISLFLIPILLFLPLLLSWKGLFPPAHLRVAISKDRHEFIFNIEKLLFFFILIGSFFSPLLFSKTNKLKKQHLLILFLIPLLLLYPVNQNNCEGILCKTISFAGNYDIIIYTIFLVLGAYLISKYLKPENNNDITLVNFLFWWLLGTVITSVLRQRYYLNSMPLLILLFTKKYDNKKVLLLWIIFFAILSCIYISYKIFFQTTT